MHAVYAFMCAEDGPKQDIDWVCDFVMDTILEEHHIRTVVKSQEVRNYKATFFNALFFLGQQGDIQQREMFAVIRDALLDYEWKVISSPE